MSVIADPEQRRVIEARIEQVYELPPMPELGRRILELQADPNADARKLAEIVQLDPSMAAQVIRYASSSYYGYAGRVTNIQDAISRVLGYDMVFNLALGLASGRSFRVPDEGPLGLTRFWEHAVCTAAMVQHLGAALPEPIRPPAGFAWLCGLLHDFGLLLLGHLFPPEFRLLNKLAAAHPELTVDELEQGLLGMGEAQDLLSLGHARIGAWLMDVWKMPDTLVVALLEHHNADYRGDYEVMVHLVQLGDALVRSMGAEPEQLSMPEHSLTVLHLLPAEVQKIAHEVGESRDDLASLSGMLVTAS
ncbi:hypothetical protein MNBD_GAMMA15-2501 [hydrothermal vent metagenome]|uniref:HDOD domain-containing protein n=1 Tax=hydrothermal vent metagenome TaxID=652676 RepID=A0A3B0YJV9_9ZZZZ